METKEKLSEREYIIERIVEEGLIDGEVINEIDIRNYQF
jgi:DNA-binding CsgD family transcriptional regulator